MVLSYDLVESARAGDVATVEQWLNSGGDANERCATMGRTLLHCIASDSLRSDEVERGRCDIARFLLSRGAAVDAIRLHPDFPTRNTPLLSASLYHRKELCELLCVAGADPNYQRFCYPHDPLVPPDFPLWFAVSDPGTIRVLLRFGADPSLKGKSHFGGGVLATPEEEAARRIHPHFASAGRLRESVRLLRDARLLRPRLRQIFALRALCHRGRAAPTSETPSAFARLIGSAPASQPKTRAATRVRAGTRARTSAKIRSSPGLPDPLAHLVCLFWLGNPPRRAKPVPSLYWLGVDST